jgi:signal transduction histidine kinase
MDTTPHAAGIAAQTLLSLLADGGRTAVLSLLHQRAIQAAGGVCSLLFEPNPRDGSLQATSGHGLDQLPSEAWHVSPADHRVAAQAFVETTALELPHLEQQLPTLHARLRTAAAVLVPLATRAERLGFLAIGVASGTRGNLTALAESDIPAGFVLALELSRLRRREDMQRDVRALLDAFAERMAATLDLQEALQPLCVAAAPLFGADCVTVWLHDRESRQLRLMASSDPTRERGQSVRTDDPMEPPAAALRTGRSGLAGQSGAPTNLLTVPLRGCRRALGAVVFEGVRVEAGDAINLLDRADELGRQLASAVETVQLVDVVADARRELEEVFASIAHLIVVIDPEGRIVRANAAFALASGCPADALQKRPLADHVGPELSAWLAELGGPLEGPVVRELSDSVLGGPFLVTVTDRVSARRHAGRVIVARDLLPLVAEREREELRGRLVQSEKLAALGQLVAGFAHELNNPLQSVLGHLELLRRTGAVPAHLRRDIQTIYRDADRSAKIVRNLLVFTGSHRLQRRRINLNGVLQKAVLRRRLSWRSQGIEVVRHYDDRLPRVVADPLLLHQAFLNILMNAEDAVVAAGHPGRIEVATHLLHGGRTAVAAIRDTGRGIGSEELTRVFEPFYTTKPVGKGTGLGLSIAYGIVQEHGGRVSAGNHPEGGAVFTVELPIGNTHD